MVMLCFILFALPRSGYAQLQELEITPTQASGSIPVFTNHPEMAAVIINSSLSALQFDSNVGIVEELSRPNDGYYVLIVRPWRQIITVTAPGYRQSRFTVNATQAREVLYYTAEPKASTGNLIPVNFVVTPSDAAIYVNDQLVEAGRTNQLPAGRQSVRLERNGYRTIEQDVEISTNNTLFTFQLQEVQVTQVVIRSEPSEATLFIDDINVGTTTYANFVYPGVYNIRMILTNYRTLETQITVEENGDNIFNFPLERFAGELLLSVTPANARVFINRQDYTGQTRITLAPGRYRLDIESDGFERFTEQLEIAQNQPLTKTVALTPLTGTLQFSVRPVEASATLINRQGQIVEQWQSLRIIRNLPVGQYTLRVEYPRHQTINETITIVEGQTLQFDRQLSEVTSQPGTLVVNTLLTGATMFLFDSSGAIVRQWTGASTLSDVPEGTYQLRAQQAGFQNFNQTVTVQSGQTQTLVVRMVASAVTAGAGQTTTPARTQPQAQTQRSSSGAGSGSGDFLKYPSFSSLTFSYSALAMPNNNFETNIETPHGLGMSIQSFNGWLMTSFDFGYNMLTLTDDAADTFDDNDYISVYSAGIGLMPTLPLGGLLIGIGGGLELNQFEDYLAESYAYINTPYIRGYVALFPKNWAIGFALDYRESYNIKGYDDKHYQEWTRTNLSLLIRL